MVLIFLVHLIVTIFCFDFFCLFHYRLLLHLVCCRFPWLRLPSRSLGPATLMSVPWQIVRISEPCGTSREVRFFDSGTAGKTSIAQRADECPLWIGLSYLVRGVLWCFGLLGRHGVVLLRICFDKYRRWSIAA